MLMQRFDRTRIVIDIGLFAGLIGVTVLIATVYVSSEQYIYFWDYSNYPNRTSYLASILQESPLKAMWLTLASLKDDYNYLPCLPLLPFALVFGDSRLVYILSCVLVYIVPYTLVLGAIATKIIPIYSQTVFWSTAVLAVLIPCTWMSTLRGLPDIGGAVLIALALLVYLQNQTLKSRGKLFLIAFLLALSILFRRHFAYSVRAFLIAIALQGLIVFLSHSRAEIRREIKDLSQFYIRLGLLSVSVLVFSPILIYQVLKYNYRLLYASYELPVSAAFEYFGLAFGWMLWLMAILGFFVGLVRRKIVRSPSVFVCIFSALSLTQWLFLSRQQGVQYTLHYNFFIVLGLAALLWTILTTIKPRIGMLILACGILFLSVNFGVSLTPIGRFSSSFRPLFSFESPPLLRKDNAQFLKFIEYLRMISKKDEWIYVAASSDVINESITEEAESQFFGWQSAKLKFISVPEIDSRDGYPLEALLRSQYVVVPSSFQYHIDPREQDIVKVVFDLFTENLDFAKDFRLLPHTFDLDGGTTIQIYERVRSTSLPTALRTLQTIQARVQPKPISQPDWINLSEKDTGWVNREQDGSITLFAQTNAENAFLYFGPIPKSINLSGRVEFSNAHQCRTFSLEISTLNQNGKVVNSIEKNMEFTSKEKTDFSLSLASKDSRYLYLDITSYKGKRADTCSLYIKDLVIAR